MDKKRWADIIAAAAVIVCGLLIPRAKGRNAAISDAARKEGTLVSYGMPNSWANYGGIWNLMKEKYGITDQDTDLESGKIIEKLKGEAAAPAADVSDLGLNYARTIETEKLSQPYLNSHWDEIPDYAKSANGLWSAGYWGAIAFTVNRDVVRDEPESFSDLLNGEYFDSICMRDPRESSTGVMAVMAMAYASGGSELNPEPGIEMFGKLQKSGNLRYIKPTLENIRKGECPISIQWDFDALSFKNQAPEMNMDVVIPSDGTFGGMYVQFITAGAPHLNAAKLMIETLYSDEGQIEFAKGFCHPIRKDVKIPDEIKAKFPPDAAYAQIHFPKNYQDLADATEKIKAGAAKYF